MTALEMPAAAAQCLPFDHRDHLDAHRFLVEEAIRLDDRDFPAWLDMLDPEIRYRVPVTSTTTARGGGREAPSDHYFDDFYSLQMRVRRLASNFAWAEDPPSRTRHIVSNVATFATGETGRVRVRSSLLLFRSRGDLRGPDLVCGHRDDTLRRAPDGRMRLLTRVVHLDEAVLQTQNLSVFL